MGWEGKCTVCCASDTDIRSHCCSSIAAVEWLSTNSLSNLRLRLPPGSTISFNFHCRHPTWRVKHPLGCPLRHIQCISSYLPKLNNTAFPDNSITASCNAIIVFNINILLLQLNYFRTFHWAVKCFCFSSQFFIKMTQTVLLRGRKCISFSKWQVRSVVISSEERWVLKCLFEPWGPIKKGEEMTLFSLHHNSNFLGLVPPALWRDPGHCARGRRGKTEWITHPGKTDVQCGVFVFHTHTFSLMI